MDRDGRVPFARHDKRYTLSYEKGYREQLLEALGVIESAVVLNGGRSLHQVYVVYKGELEQDALESCLAALPYVRTVEVDKQISLDTVVDSDSTPADPDKKG